MAKQSPIRLQLSRKKGFNLQEHSKDANGLEAVNCARPGKWGNPFRVRNAYLATGKTIKDWNCDTDFEYPEDAVCAFKDMISDPELVKDYHYPIHEISKILTGKNLACFCKLNAPCHADVLLEIANTDVSEVE